MTLEAHAQAIADTADWVRRQSDDMADAIEKRVQELSDFLGDAWSGAGASSHEIPWRDWADGAERMVASFYTDVDALYSAANMYTTTEIRNKKSIDRLIWATDLPPDRA
ncbi:hypothetical protein D5S18_28400 [Nocardia panacis]|uniref:ESAT-6-like protein n=1 Tax=Nocardia panacis TaxID=2340916 RepID=A0A3A4K9I4_9NOCA|nr:WXG100 family type VII secretion target [Nocardia panacis]RJO69823.1 hypothetical protein D5S18_28400 [Nocardia panacis]